MLDHFCIFTKGGVLLWAMSFSALKGDPVNALVRGCLLEDRSGEADFEYTSPAGGAYTLKWALDNALGLVLVAVHQRALKLAYVEELLERAGRAFAPRFRAGVRAYPDFDAKFRRLLADAEARADAARRPAAGAATGGAAARPAPAPRGAAGGEAAAGDEDGGEADGAAAAPAAPALALAAPAQLAGDSGDSAGEDSAGGGAFDAAALAKKLGKRGGPGARAGTKATPPAAAKAAKGAPPKKGKAARRWDDLGGAEAEEGPLDFTEGAPPTPADAPVSDFKQQSLVDAAAEESSDEDDDGADSGAAGGATAKPGVLASFVRGLSVGVVGTAALARADLAPALADLKRKLMERNVAEDIAESLCESVAATLEGQRLGSFTRVATAVRAAFEEALTRILTPRRSVDVLREVRAARGRGRPYTIVFVGVNGVGKSTNLAKVAYWLKQNGASVMLAACDTFRAGAVEQLKTHAARLGAPLYERGYEKDPAKVAFEAGKAAARAGTDVLLVDTAGRMQDNEPLMRALSHLVTLNEPDLVLFVGEALVGNDGVDQLTKFNRRLADLAPAPDKRRLIDGIVLTKFDTIDDKVGAALSMVYASGAPVMFVGCGQTYVDLRRLDVKSVVRALLK